jgi:hypothetical protein
MPTSEHRFTLQELAAALIRQEGIHEGQWVLNVTFAATGTSVRADPESGSSVPGLLVSVTGVTLVQATAPSPSTIDAAVVNPRISTQPTPSQDGSPRSHAATKRRGSSTLQ